MRLVLTGGGTGGHVYPALEVARLAHSRGAELLYLGSIRGQEGKLCEAHGILFKGFPSEPLYSLKSARGWRSLVKLIDARRMAKRHLAAARADVVFSTGGYSAGPILAAARSLRIPYVIHDGNSVPGRANRMFGRQAKAFLSTFFATERFYRDRAVVRTGQPIRKELREAASVNGVQSGSMVLVLGGSQGSQYLNEAVPNAVLALGLPVSVIHASGPTHFAETCARVKGLNLTDYEVQPYLDTEALASAYGRADLVVCRSGGTLAELAMFGRPSVLVPLPTSADHHQLHNAEEFADMGAATITGQQSPPFDEMTSGISNWLGDEGRRSEASRRLREWDVPDATDRIVTHIEAAAK